MFSDAWALGCAIFEIRAGSALFESFFGGPDEILRQIVQTLGRLPDLWWSRWENRHLQSNLAITIRLGPAVSIVIARLSLYPKYHD